MSKISLTNLVNLQNETSAVSAINANNAVLTTALDNTLSRDGTSPNTMGSSLDMNSNRIINLPAPAADNDPIRLSDLNTATLGAGSAGVTSLGAVTGVIGLNPAQLQMTGHTLGLVATTPTVTSFAGLTGAITLNSSQFTMTGQQLGLAPTNSVTTSSSLGMVGDGTTDNLAAFNTWKATLTSTGGVLVFGPGKFKFSAPATVDIPGSAGWATTSASSSTIGIGVKIFTVASGLSISAGQSATAVNYTAGVASYMTGTVTSYVGTTLTITTTTVSGSGTFIAWDIVQNFQDTNAITSITLAGYGQDVTTLYFPTGDGLTFNFSSQQHSVHIRDLSVTTGNANAGSGITFANTTYPFFGTFIAQSDITNVTCRGDNGYASTMYWTNGVNVYNVSDVNFHNLNVYGSSTPSGVGVMLATSTTPPSGLFNSPLKGGTVYDFSNCNFTFLSAGVYVGYNTQTVQITNSFFGQCVNGCFTPVLAGDLQGLSVTNSTFFTTDTCILSSTGIPNLMVSGNLLNVATGVYAIVVPQEDSTIYGNTFIPRDAVNTGAGGMHILSGNSTSPMMISANTFASVGQPVFLSVGTSNINVQSNKYVGTTGSPDWPVLNSGSGNTIGGGSS